LKIEKTNHESFLERMKTCCVTKTVPWVPPRGLLGGAGARKRRQKRWKTKTKFPAWFWPISSTATAIVTTVTTRAITTTNKQNKQTNKKNKTNRQTN
jgi:hypothetical protein